MERLASHTTTARRFVSSSNCFTYMRSFRPRIFQSTYLSSSPGWYILCSANSTEKPRRGERCSPLRNPSTTPWVMISRPPSFETSIGSSRSRRARPGEVSERYMEGATYPLAPVEVKRERRGGGNLKPDFTAFRNEISVHLLSLCTILAA